MGMLDIPVQEFYSVSSLKTPHTFEQAAGGENDESHRPPMNRPRSLSRKTRPQTVSEPTPNRGRAAELAGGRSPRAK